MEKIENELKIPTELPSFFNYKNGGIGKENEKDSGYETLQDFFLSWTLRCAEEKYKQINTILQEYSKNIVFVLIYGRNNDKHEYIVDKKMSKNFIITKVNTIRQKNYIDLITVIDIEENSVKKKYILNIENKCYFKIGDKQLEKSKEFIENNYDSKEFEIINFVIFHDDCILKGDDGPTQIKKCRDNNYRFLTIGNIQELSEMQEETKNALFDEYWFRWA